MIFIWLPAGVGTVSSQWQLGEYTNVPCRTRATFCIGLGVDKFCNTMLGSEQASWAHLPAGVLGKVIDVQPGLEVRLVRVIHAAKAKGIGKCSSALDARVRHCRRRHASLQSHVKV